MLQFALYLFYLRFPTYSYNAKTLSISVALYLWSRRFDSTVGTSAPPCDIPFFLLPPASFMTPPVSLSVLALSILPYDLTPSPRPHRTLSML